MYFDSYQDEFNNTQDLFKFKKSINFLLILQFVINIELTLRNQFMYLLNYFIKFLRLSSFLAECNDKYEP